MPLELDAYHRLMQLVGSLHIKSRQFTEHRLKILGMTYPQLAALMALHNTDGITQTELAVHMETDRTTAMVICDSLEKKDWTRRAPDGADRRVNRIFLTESGRQVYSEARTRLREDDNYMASKLTVKKLRQIITDLEVLHGTMKELLDK